MLTFQKFRNINFKYIKDDQIDAYFYNHKKNSNHSRITLISKIVLLHLLFLRLFGHPIFLNTHSSSPIPPISLWLSYSWSMGFYQSTISAGLILDTLTSCFDPPVFWVDVLGYNKIRWGWSLTGQLSWLSILFFPLPCPTIYSYLNLNSSLAVFWGSIPLSLPQFECIFNLKWRFKSCLKESMYLNFQL